MQFWKLQALGNHFVFVLHESGTDYPKLAQIVCKGATGIGGDGLLAVDLRSDPPVVRMWNPDGTEDFCGNGMCCALKLLQFLGVRQPTFLHTPYGDVRVRCDELDDLVAVTQISIPRPTLEPGAIPLAPEFGRNTDLGFEIDVDGRMFDVIPSSNGNIHTVIFTDQPVSPEIFERYSPSIEVHPLFPYKTNVLWCYFENEVLRMRIWERSVGETLSCGTGAAAAVAICELAGKPVPATVQVVMRGGTAQVTLRPTEVEFSTRATLVFEGSLPGIRTTALVGHRSVSRESAGFVTQVGRATPNPRLFRMD